MAVNLSSIRELLFPGLRGVTGEYAMIPKQWDKVFDKGKSDMTVERTVAMRFLGLAQAKNEGQATPFDNGAGQRYVYNQEHTEIALGYAMTRKSIDDNLYKKQFRPSNLGLNDSFAQTKEILGANVFNNGNVYQTAIGGDGVPLFSPSHPIDGGTVANRPSTELELNESSLQAALLQVRGFKNQAGLKIMARGKKLVVPPQLEYVACRLLKTDLRPGTADNDVNATVATGGVPDGYVVMDFLTSAFAWFVLTDKPGLLYLDRIGYETDMQVDFTTDNLLVKAYERYSFGYFDPMAAWGTYPTM